MFFCPQCGEDTETLNEGCCEPCRNQNQIELDTHNSDYDFWQTLTDTEKDQRIKQ